MKIILPTNWTYVYLLWFDKEHVDAHVKRHVFIRIWNLGGLSFLQFLNSCHRAPGVDWYLCGPATRDNVNQRWVRRTLVTSSQCRSSSTSLRTQTPRSDITATRKDGNGMKMGCHFNCCWRFIYFKTRNFQFFIVFLSIHFYIFLPSLRVFCEIVQWQKWDHPRRCEPGISLPGCLIRVVFWSAMITFFGESMGFPKVLWFWINQGEKLIEGQQPMSGLLLLGSSVPGRPKSRSGPLE